MSVLTLGGAAARVFDQAGRPVGGAFLVAPGHLLTAAHVVNLACGMDSGSAVWPAGDLSVDFPTSAVGTRYSARLVHWVPPAGDGPEDIAGLRLDRQPPAAVHPVSLVDLPDPFDRRVITFGFPRQADAGAWSVGRLRGPQANGWVQMDLDETSQFAIQAGFSGAPVWDARAAAVVGMVVAGFTGPGARTGYMIPAATLFDAWPALREMVRPPSPFRGLGAFGEGDAEWFFGRAELAGRIAELTRTAPALTVVGPSGIGKSSLLHAGVLPRLRQRPGLLVASTRPTEALTPLRSVALALDRLIEPDRDPLARLDQVTELAGRLADGATGEIVGSVLARRGARRLLLVLDQMEEALVPGVETMSAFAGVVAHVLAPGARMALLAGLRADFLGPALRQPILAALFGDQRILTVGEMGSDELRAAITGPLERIGSVRYEPGLVQRLLDDVGHAPGSLPLLQFTLTNLWERQRDGLLTHQAYEDLGGVERTLANHADQVWSGLEPDQAEVARRLLVQLIAPTPHTAAFVRRTARRGELDPMRWQMATRLATARLLVVREAEPTGPTPGVELAHESLITHWPRLREFGERDREFRTWQETLRQRIGQWQSHRRARDRLLVGADLRDARRWLSARRADLSPADRGYVQASLRRRRVRRSWAAAVTVVLLVAGGAVFTVRDRGLRDIAATDLAAQVRQVRAGDPYGAVELTIRAYRTRHNKATVDAVRSEFRREAGLDRLIPDQSALGDAGTATYNALSGKVSADGRTIATVAADGAPVVWRIDRTGMVRHRLADQAGAADFAEQAAVSADGRYAAFVKEGFPRVDADGIHPTTCAAGGPTSLNTCVVLFDTATARPLFTRQIADIVGLRPVQALSVDPTGRVLAAVVPGVGDTYTVRTWDVPSGRPRGRLPLPGRIATVAGFWLAPGGHRAAVVAVRTEPGRAPAAALSYLDLDTGPVGQRTLLDGLLQPQSVSVSADGRRVAASIISPEQSGSDQVAVWDLLTGRRLVRFDVTEVEARGALALDPTGSRLFDTWRPDANARTRPTDVGQLGEQLARLDTSHVSVWSVPAGRRSSLAASVTGPWDVLRPLGPGADTAVALVNGDAVGLVLPAPGDPPLGRLTRLASSATADDRVDPGDAVAALCRVLADRGESSSIRALRPAGGYTGSLCD